MSKSNKSIRLKNLGMSRKEVCDSLECKLKLLDFYKSFDFSRKHKNSKISFVKKDVKLSKINDYVFKMNLIEDFESFKRLLKFKNGTKYNKLFLDLASFEKDHLVLFQENHVSFVDEKYNQIELENIDWNETYTAGFSLIKDSNLSHSSNSDNLILLLDGLKKD